MELLTVKDIADLKGCSEQYVRALIQRDALPHETKLAVNGRPQHLIPLTALDTTLQQKWYRRNGVTPPPELRLVKTDAPPKVVKSLEMYTEQQREQIGYWISLLEKWQAFRDEFQGSKAEADAAFIKQEQLDISPATLYRRLAAHKSNDMDGLVELRGQWRKGQSDMNNEVWRIFLSYYLDQANDPVQKCIRSTQDYLDIRNPALRDNFPSDSAFYWRINQDIPPAITTYNRKGPKALHDRYAPYIRRLYDSMMSNDYWVGDNHTFDFMTTGDNGRPHRLYLTGILDARSTAIVGWQVTHAPCGDAKPDTQRVLDLLCDYRVDHSLGIEEMDFMRQVNHFLGAKKSEGMAKLSTYSYRRRLDMFYNHINKSAAEVTTNDIRDVRLVSEQSA